MISEEETHRPFRKHWHFCVTEYRDWRYVLLIHYIVVRLYGRHSRNRHAATAGIPDQCWSMHPTCFVLDSISFTVIAIALDKPRSHLIYNGPARPDNLLLPTYSYTFYPWPSHGPTSVRLLPARWSRSWRMNEKKGMTSTNRLKIPTSVHHIRIRFDFLRPRVPLEDVRADIREALKRLPQNVDTVVKMLDAI